MALVTSQKTTPMLLFLVVRGVRDDDVVYNTTSIDAHAIEETTR